MDRYFRRVRTSGADEAYSGLEYKHNKEHQHDTINVTQIHKK